MKTKELKDKIKAALQSTKEQRDLHKENSKMYYYYEGQYIGLLAVYTEIK